ncbi:multiple epidermal growth factor-like domains protein 10 [Ostrea edulis]|uniref:multiple epidermal growth factor-like domains protein 10 n=1 Tax=Ostrea edulis TaxID=37623 RepID=UPI0024AF6F37|nr:multiple epidermal growth factor-like domains protein 10 [Ostrea edulis]
MELVNLAVMYLMFFSVRATFQNITTGCYDGYYRNETSGTCIECPQGYKGPDCSVSCVDGFYGKNCQHKCPSTCLNCNVIDGSCRKDCPPGYTRPNCSVPCVNGLYGKNCQHKCSSTCSNCNSIDGKCPKGLSVIGIISNVARQNQKHTRRRRQHMLMHIQFG